MDLGWWIAGYLVEMAFLVWVVRFGGAARLEGTFSSGFLLSIFAPRWTADGIKLFAWLTMVVSTIGFVIGIVSPELR